MTRPARSRSLPLAVAGLVALLVGLTPSAAAAHDGLVIAVPAPGELAGGEVELLQMFFGEPIETVNVRVLDPDSTDITGEITQPYEGFVEVVVPPLEIEGVYVVAYDVSYADEATFEAVYQFTYDARGRQPELLVAGEYETSRSSLFVAATWVLVGVTIVLALLLAWRLRQIQLARLAAEDGEHPGH